LGEWFAKNLKDQSIQKSNVSLREIKNLTKNIQINYVGKKYVVGKENAKQFQKQHVFQKQS